MTTPFSATPEMDIPANGKTAPKMHRYAVASVVLFYTKHGFFEFVCYDVSVETAISQGRAIDKIYQPLRKKYRECNGYIVRVKAEPIAD